MKNIQPENTYITLMHYPVYNKKGDVITSAITSLDVHDVARLVQTYGLGGYYVMTPVKNQFKLLCETIEFWQEGVGQQYNPTRSRSFEQVKPAQSFGAVRKALGKDSIWVVTTARHREKCKTLDQIDDLCAQHPSKNLIFIFGTGYGLTDDFLNSIDHVLCPIEGGTAYNHLSVRSAITIIVDRLFGR